MFTSKQIEELSKQTKIRKRDFIIILDTLQQNGYRFKKKKDSSIDHQTTLEYYLIGKGSQSHVFLGESIENGNEVALKISNCSEEAYKDMIDKIKILSQIYKHNFVVEVYENFILEEQQICIQVVELCQKSLKDQIDEMKLKETKFSVDQVMKVFLFAFNVLCEIHANDIIHFDIKPSNILLSKDGKYKLADFGMSQNVQQHNIHNLSLGSRKNFYLSPEQNQNIEKGENKQDIIKIRNSTDIFSMGVTLLEILGVDLDMKIFLGLQTNNYTEIKKQIDCDKLNLYSFVENFMLQQEENRRYLGFRLRLQFIRQFENIFPFQEEQERISKVIKIYETNSNNNQNKNLACLYFYLSSTYFRNQDSSLIEKSLSIIKNLKLSESFEASIFYEHYSQILINSQKYEESNNYLILSYEIKVSLFQNVHLEIVHNLFLQSICLKYLGNFQKMLEQSQRSEQILSLIFEKKDNPDIATTLNHIGYAFKSLGQTQKCLEYYLNALQIFETLFSGNHPDIATSLNSVGYAYSLLDNGQQGLEYSLKGLQMRETLFSGNHPDIAESLNDVGIAYGHLDNKQKQEEYYLKSLQMREILFQGNHPEIAESLYNIGNSLDDEQKGLEYQLKSLQMSKALFSGNHHDIAQSLSVIGQTYKSLGDKQKALEYYQEAFQMYEKLVSRDHHEIANSIGLLYSSLDDYQKALEYHLKASQICETLNLGNSLDFAIYQYNVGELYTSLGDLKKGLEYFLKSLQMRQTLFPGNHIDMASTLDNVGYVYYRSGDLQKSLQYYLKSLKMYQALITGSDLVIAKTLSSIGSLFDKIGNLEKALEYFQKAFQMYQKLFQEDDVRKLEEWIIEIKQVI